MNYCVLGTRAGAGPYNSQHPSGLALMCAHEVLLFDCGEGSVLQMQRAGVRRSSISAVFITHRHADHCLGLPGLVAAFSSDRRVDDLTLVAPLEVHNWLRQTIENLQIELAFEIHYRTCSDTLLGEVYRSGGVRVMSAPVEHRVPAFAFRAEEELAPRLDFERLEALGAASKAQISAFRRDGKLQLPDGREILLRDFLVVPRSPFSLAYSGDTAVCEALRVASREADVLICEATFTEKLAERAALTQHMTARAAAELAATAGVRKLVLTHFSTRYRDASQHLAEARELFAEVEAAVELEIWPVRG